ncbi:MAG: hypothetical protein WA952_16800 [Lewinella sp.]
MPCNLLAFVILLTLLACGEVADGNAETGNDDTSVPERELPDSAEQPETLTNTTGDLQGTWRSVDDSLHTLTFEGNLMIMANEGEPAGEAENFVLGSTCPGAPEASSDNDESQYLSVPDADRCYYLIELTDTTLELGYLGRGNTLRYIR